MDGTPGWDLRPLAAYQTSVRISDMAWNPHLPLFMAFVCEDGSLQMADAASQVHFHARRWAAAVPGRAGLALSTVYMKPRSSVLPSLRSSQMSSACRTCAAPARVGIYPDKVGSKNCCCDVQMGPAKQISLSGDVFPLLQAHIVDGAQRAAGLKKHARMVCEWGQHPMTLLLTAGPSPALC